MNQPYFIGLMTGTSLDGVDAVLVDVSGPTPILVAAQGRPLPGGLRDTLLSLQASGPDEIDRAWRAGIQLAECYAEAVLALLLRAAVPAEQVAAIGNHGQTVRHRPERGYTVQLGDHARLAELTGITVVGDFRSRDVAAGGQGAPLVPAFHQAVFADSRRHRVIVNIGGIANLTDLPPGGDVVGFDTGPGNVLLDAWIAQHQGQRYDTSGQWAATGKVLPDLLDLLLAESYFAMPSPKSTGRDLFHAGWLARRLTGRSDAPQDVQATLAALTVQSIADAILLQAPGVDEVYICGGGAHNTHLMHALGRALPGVALASTAELGIDPDWVEAYAFAWLAQRCLSRQPGNLPQVTGAQGPRILGAIWPN
ncbi:anhydro-N-acetylmuramic acid kinase [Chitiniphilus eburneus]|uniref:Anhydro-N-acetylmuramic acid kinase n=1 Tax=Chitiniphilus eburneus TaxID=2571148 RepID=A0A4U0Q102_9NEIS|nr:anhydro-N-acetylmuramic acid kinase [Chitiniphilus eburneus]TJZ74270.1 anhydro-N-acetylmuramic acid kinase [Chitiniphilus eburneus]